MIYFVFAFSQYYPSGGTGDLVAITRDIDEAFRIAAGVSLEFCEVMELDPQTLQWKDIG